MSGVHRDDIQYVHRHIAGALCGGFARMMELSWWPPPYDVSSEV